MRRLLLGVTTVLVALAVASPALAATKTVSITKTGFVPTTVTISTGDSITWKNADTRNHQVVSDRGSFVSPILRPGQSYTFTFQASGTYKYRDGLYPDNRGTVEVKGPPPSASLGATVPIVVYGMESHLQGVVSNLKSGELVTILSQPYGQSSYAEVTTVTTTTNGAFDYIVKPTVLTNYQVRWKSATSQPVTLQVRPKITLQPGRRGWFLTRVTAAKSFAGRSIYVQRRTQFGQWISVQKYTLGSLSGKLFKKPKTKGYYRIFMTINQAGVGYLEGWSGTQRIR